MVISMIASGTTTEMAFGSTPSGSLTSTVLLIGTPPSLMVFPVCSARFCAFNIGPKSNCVKQIYPTITNVNIL